VEKGLCQVFENRPKCTIFVAKEFAFSINAAHLRPLSHRLPAEVSYTLNGKVLVLNQSYEPISVCSAKKALLLLFLTKAEMVEQRTAVAIRSVRDVYPFPSVIRLSAYLRVPFKKIELSRKNILRRDGFKCMYCGDHKPPLTVDHIIPRSRGGTDQWENLVCACIKCNNRKGNRTPEEAHMKLLTVPRKPHHVLFLKHYAGKVEETWRPYLFMD
jgi:5-methylcytosine-specific restriction endonuclease McrA